MLNWGFWGPKGVEPPEETLLLPPGNIGEPRSSGPEEDIIEGEYYEVEEPIREATEEEKSQKTREEQEASKERIRELEEELKREREGAKREAKVLSEIEKVKRLEQETELAELKQRRTKAKGGSLLDRAIKRSEQLEKFTGKASKTAYRIGTLGGPIKMQHKELYGGSAPLRNIHKPSELSSMRSLSIPRTSPPTLGGPSMRGMVSLRSLSGTLLSKAAVPVPIKNLGQSPLLSYQLSGSRLEMLRRMGVPKGLNNIEQEAYVEIRKNGDVDTPSHVISQLAQLGVPRKEAEKAIKSLMEKRLIKRGKKELEVIR